MCGFAGFLQAVSAPASQMDAIVAAMAGTLAHRGPDDEGTWVDEASGIALGSRRLAILDLSSAGHQPMVSSDGRVVLAYNGEIYNHRAVRRLLEREGVRFRGDSDTEVLVEAIASWGVEPALAHVDGMFAFASWQTDTRVLTLARDRLGEKPLYYGWFGSTLVFGSELKACRRHPAFRGDVDRSALVAYLERGYFTGRSSVFNGVQRLLPGTYVEVREPRDRDSEPRVYWDLHAVAQHGRAHPFHGSRAEGVEAVASALEESVTARLVADVPVGAFLSGGIDSSAVVAAMTRSSGSVHTFSIGFSEGSFDEAPYARAVARHLGTTHTELYVTADEALGTIPQLPTIYDEPFADSSAIPTLLVSLLAKRSVTVALSGDGGDELFAGYTRHAAVRRLWPMLRRVPLPVRTSVARAVAGRSPRALDKIVVPLQHAIPRRFRQTHPGEKVQKLAPLLVAHDIESLYERMTAFPPWELGLVIGAGAKPERVQQASFADPVDIVRYLDTKGYLPDDILVKVDRAAMSVSLETRVPLLAPPLVELAWSMPPAWHWEGGRGKALLRAALRRDVPDELVDRPKMGFGVPLATWLRGPLREWAYDLLDPVTIRNDGYLHPERVRVLLDEHVGGGRDWKYILWSVLMFQAWLHAGT